MDLEQKAIKRIQLASELSLKHYEKPLVCAYSGGKDSDTLLELFKRAGVPFEVHNSHTTADAPQTVKHIQETFRELELQGIKCKIQMPTYKGEKNKHVETDSIKTYASNTNNALLLPDIKRTRLHKQVHCYRR